MKRLTFEGNFCDISMCRENPCPYNGSCSQKETWERLKYFEDLEEQGRLVVLHKDYTNKDGEEALRLAMWKCGQTNNAVTRYTADAIAEKLTREEAEQALKEGAY